MNEHILSIDVGLRNLSLCIMSCLNNKDFKSYNIHLWENYNTLEDDTYYCKSIQKNGNICNKKCTYKYNLNDEISYCCKPHFPKNFLPLNKTNNFKKKLIKDYLLQDIAKKFINTIQEIYDLNIEHFNKLTSIVIELQPKINPLMKCVSHVLYGKLIELYKDTNVIIKFVRASQKLKAYTGPYLECKLKGAYAKRKWLSVEYCKWFLVNKFNEDEGKNWLTYFETKTVQPDMGDSFLMAINLLHGLQKRREKCIK